ncbi:hypothetical protein N9L66_04605 [Porticoccaceae bacterium]|nr:hypothetical protein [Porticoccaceae bacterium]
MCVIYEKVFQPNEPRAQFSSCCGASDKGLDDYVGCRSCHGKVKGYLREGAEGEMRSLITDPKIRSRFDRFVDEPAFSHFNDWDQWKQRQAGLLCECIVVEG